MSMLISVRTSTGVNDSNTEHQQALEKRVLLTVRANLVGKAVSILVRRSRITDRGLPPTAPQPSLEQLPRTLMGSRLILLAISIHRI